MAVGLVTVSLLVVLGREGRGREVLAAQAGLLLSLAAGAFASARSAGSTRRVRELLLAGAPFVLAGPAAYLVLGGRALEASCLVVLSVAALVLSAGPGLFLCRVLGSPLAAQLLVGLLVASLLWAPLGLSSLLAALDEPGRQACIRGILAFHPLGGASDLLGVDWLRGGETYRRSAMGSLYFFRYPPWAFCAGVQALTGLPLLLLALLRIRGEPGVPSREGGL